MKFVLGYFVTLLTTVGGICLAFYLGAEHLGGSVVLLSIVIMVDVGAALTYSLSIDGKMKELEERISKIEKGENRP